MTPRVGVACVVIVSALALAGCGGAGGGPSPSPSVTEASASPSVTASESPTPTPSPSATFDPHPDVADLQLTTSGLLPLTLGLPPATNPGAAMIVFDPEYCIETDIADLEGDPGRWQPNYADKPFSVDAADTQVVRLDIWDPAITTPEGIGIGSTLAEVQAAYPDLVASSDAIVSHVWWIQDEHGTVVFETQGADLDGSSAAAPSDPVILMRALSTAWGTEVGWGAANSGNIADACF